MVGWRRGRAVEGRVGRVGKGCLEKVMAVEDR